MFDFSLIQNKEIADKVREEARVFMGRCHFGTQGIAKTETDVINAVNKLRDSGFLSIAFDTEMVYVPLALELLEGKIPVHAAVSYPMGRMTLSKKLKDLERLHSLGVRDTCVCLDWQAIFSGEYDIIENEAREIMRRFGDSFIKLAFVIPATLMSDTEMIACLRALDAAGIVSVKVNPGAKLGVSYEEVALINRNFPSRFDIHPSGNIRTLGDVERYLELGCDNIHTVSSLEITEEFIKRQLSRYGGM